MSCRAATTAYHAEMMREVATRTLIALSAPTRRGMLTVSGLRALPGALRERAADACSPTSDFDCRPAPRRVDVDKDGTLSIGEANKALFAGSRRVASRPPRPAHRLHASSALERTHCCSRVKSTQDGRSPLAANKFVKWL